MLLQVLFYFFVSQNYAHANRHELFSGVATEDGKVSYTENHDVEFNDKNVVIEAVTTYTDANGKEVGTLKSDFRLSLSLPEHIFLDERTKGSYGIRRSEDKITLFNREAGKAEQTIELASKGDQERVQVGCQGFNYFLKDKLDELKVKKTLPVLFMIPGELSTYKFILELVRENSDQTYDFKVKIENWMLRIFAPHLEFKYDRKIDRIVWYKGISNIKNARGKNAVVEITYKYSL